MPALIQSAAPALENLKRTLSALSGPNTAASALHLLARKTKKAGKKGKKTKIKGGAIAGIVIGIIVVVIILIIVLLLLRKRQQKKAIAPAPGHV